MTGKYIVEYLTAEEASVLSKVGATRSEVIDEIMEEIAEACADGKRHTTTNLGLLGADGTNRALRSLKILGYEARVILHALGTVQIKVSW